MTAATRARTDVVAAVRAVPDPEVPVISIEDLGILRSVEVDGEVVRVVITPTYSGCPAMRAIEDGIGAVVAAHGLRAEVDVRLAPAWTTDWMSERGRDALARFGIAPPQPGAGVAAAGPVSLDLSVRRVACPLCGSEHTEQISRFGSTSCKALRRCLDCHEPFEEFKAI
ncbi:1,2-phenylacetyl-CoA epoxidase subunit PaaD [Luteipulveratus flavus]|uniref:Phenylacetate-CoA oxygenase subunit PaaJ n=1 Tax=Luteipulveratus flavus TaxID=3031728 RepID=A0ABT6C8V6_9MICO|nr:1,2-phenylacetyl-CoA epoxidase subunit PaaD [Luteipulveratus sp. YIM 133296]MDF8265325.1 phenylacetate-CoA oxygenase subunit PaaJ [Luteipulveratus sp. YIM 133296]